MCQQLIAKVPDLDQTWHIV